MLQSERAQRNRATVDPLFDSLVDAYAAFAESELDYIQNAYDEPTLNYLKWMPHAYVVDGNVVHVDVA